MKIICVTLFSILTICCAEKSFSQSKTRLATLTLQVPESVFVDDVRVFSYPYGTDLAGITNQYQYLQNKRKVGNNRFIQNLNFLNYNDGPIQVEFQVPYPDGTFSFVFLIYPDDSLIMSVDKSRNVQFEGKDKDYFKLSHDLVNAWTKYGNHKNRTDYISDLHSYDSGYYEQRDIITHAPETISLMKKNKLLAIAALRCEFAKVQYLMYLKEPSLEIYSKAWRPYQEKYGYQTQLDGLKYAKYAENAGSFPFYFIWRYVYDSCRLKGLNTDYRRVCDYAIERLDGSSRERTLAVLLDWARGGNYEYAQYIITRAKPYIISDDLLAYFKRAEIALSKGQPIRYFSFTDLHGKKVSNRDFDGFVLLLDFWYTGCGNCVKIHPLIDSLREKYSDQKLKVVSINALDDNKMWKKGLNTKKYSSPGNVDVYTNGLGASHPFISFYGIHSYPQLMIVGKKGTAFNLAPPDPRGDFQGLCKVIEEALQEK